MKQLRVVNHVSAYCLAIENAYLTISVNKHFTVYYMSQNWSRSIVKKISKIESVQPTYCFNYLIKYSPILPPPCNLEAVETNIGGQMLL